MARSFSQEFLLAAACTIWPPSDRRTEAIREAAAGPLDWDRFLRVVTHHRVVGLVHDGLTRALPAVPPAIARQIGAQAAALVRQDLALAAEGVRLQRLFAKKDLPVVFLKGVSLAMLAYGNLGLRHSKDLDLVVRPKSIRPAVAVLELNGYRRLQPPSKFSESQLRTWMHRCKEILYVNDEKAILVELHCRLFDNSKLMPDTPDLLRIAPITREIGLCTLGEDDLFVYLCAHGAVDRWFRLKWLADVAALLARQPEGGIERLYRAAKVRGLGRPAAQAILLCHRLMGTVLSEQLIMMLNTDAIVRWLEALAMNAMTADKAPTDLRFGTTLNALARFFLRSDWHYSLAELKVYSISPVDILTLPLPERLLPLYPALRLPLWVWRHSVYRRGLPN
jgi:Uncharacterised nucleotidyltransferase